MGGTTPMPGYVTDDRPKIVTSRFEHDDGHTLERYLAPAATRAAQGAGR
jgi:hypothetical protein